MCVHAKNSACVYGFCTRAQVYREKQKCFHQYFAMLVIVIIIIFVCHQIWRIHPPTENSTVQCLSRKVDLMSRIAITDTYCYICNYTLLHLYGRSTLLHLKATSIWSSSAEGDMSAVVLYVSAYPAIPYEHQFSLVLLLGAHLMGCFLPASTHFNFCIPLQY
jgi:hypothetical protein